MITHIYNFQIKMQPVTEITTSIHVVEQMWKGETIKKKIAILNVYQDFDKTHRESCTIEKRILKKKAKLKKNHGIRHFFITQCANTVAANRQGSRFDAEKWRFTSMALEDLQINCSNKLFTQ